MSDTSQRSRENRLKAALRANLQRRKAQTRGRSETPADEPDRTDRIDPPKPADQ